MITSTTCLQCEKSNHFAASLLQCSDRLLVILEFMCSSNQIQSNQVRGAAQSFGFNRKKSCFHFQLFFPMIHGLWCMVGANLEVGATCLRPKEAGGKTHLVPIESLTHTNWPSRWEQLQSIGMVWTSKRRRRRKVRVLVFGFVTTNWFQLKNDVFLLSMLQFGHENVVNLHSFHFSRSWWWMNWVGSVCLLIKK